MAIIPTFFLVNIRKENVFYDILEREDAFLGYKNNKFKSCKIDIFPKGVNPRFLPKNRHFSNFSFSDNMGLPSVFYDILRRKNAFPGYKNKKFKKLKNWHIFKGINPWFWSKMDIFPKGLTHGFGINMAIFSRIFFRQYRPGKCLLLYFRTKERLSRL